MNQAKNGGSKLRVDHVVILSPSNVDGNAVVTALAKGASEASRSGEELQAKLNHQRALRRGGRKGMRCSKNTASKSLNDSSQNWTRGAEHKLS